MIRKIALLLLAVVYCSRGVAQVQDTSLYIQTVYKTFKEEKDYKAHQYSKKYWIHYPVDVPIIVVGGAATIYAFTKIYRKDPTPYNDILRLDKNNVPFFDRWTAGWHDDNLDKASYYPFYAVMPLPFLFLADRTVSKEFGRVGMLYLEAFAFTGVIYAGSVYFVDRFRPDVYNTSLGLEYRTNGNFRNSFFAGHVAVVATSTFFCSRVYYDYHPDAKNKWILYGASAAATLGMAWMRLYAGKHFTSDILLGMAVGTASGLLVPHVHKNHSEDEKKWSFMPTYDRGPGLAFTYKL